jgi:hypothetical protein
MQLDPMIWPIQPEPGILNILTAHPPAMQTQLSFSAFKSPPATSLPNSLHPDHSPNFLSQFPRRSLGLVKSTPEAHGIA